MMDESWRNECELMLRLIKKEMDTYKNKDIGI